MKKKSIVLIIILFIISSCKDKESSPATSLTKSDLELVNQAISEINPKDQSLIFRRSTLIVRNVEKSLLLYQDAMGMEVIYDQVIERPHPFKEGEQQKVKLVFLKALDKYQGVLGLIDYEFESANKSNIPIRKEGFIAQNVVLLFNSNDLESRFEKIKKVPDVEIISEPKLTHYPSYDGKDTIKVIVSKFYDPDGFIVEFNKLLDDI